MNLGKQFRIGTAVVDELKNICDKDRYVRNMTEGLLLPPLDPRKSAMPTPHSKEKEQVQLS
jgi:hypothetical protein